MKGILAMRGTKKTAMFFVLFLMVQNICACSLRDEFTGNGMEVQAETEVQPELIFSADSGMYDEEFYLAISATNDATIYYTLDGTDPATSPFRKTYTQPILIQDATGQANRFADLTPAEQSVWYQGMDTPSAQYQVEKCTVVRAYAEECAPVYKSYFVGYVPEDFHNLPMMSVVTDPSNLFNNETGIYMVGTEALEYLEQNPEDIEGAKALANYNQRGKSWERKIHLDFFETDGSYVYSQNCGIRIQGNNSRNEAQKSFRFYARSDYGDASFSYDLLNLDTADQGLTTESTFILRSGGNDANYLKFKDTYIQELASGRAIETQEGRPCLLFINGEYWGLYTLMEDYTDDYFAAQYGVAKEEVIYYKNNEIEEGEASDIIYYDKLMNYARTYDLSNEIHYETICSMLDVQSFADYMATELYILNMDWPDNNVGLWRTRNTNSLNPYADGKWRFVLMDTDMSMNQYGNADYNNSSILKMQQFYPDNDFVQLFNALIQNETFKEMFAEAMLDIVNVNFAVPRAHEVLWEYHTAYYEEIDRYFARFDTGSQKGDMSNPCFQRLYEYAMFRNDYAVTMLQEGLGLEGGPARLNIHIIDDAQNLAGGSIRINGQEVMLVDGLFTGMYLQDYPVTIEAVPEEGHVFTGWTGLADSSHSSVTVSLNEASELTAHLEIAHE